MHIFIRKVSLTSCVKCGKKVRQHVVCTSCGFYQGREVINTLKKVTKKAKKEKEAKK